MAEAAEVEVTEVRKSTDPCRCCWHCRFFIRPIPIEFLLDGPVTDVCTVDRIDHYAQPDQWHHGDKDVLPDDVCDRFEIDPPPKVN
jgi:hypothetical protein